MDADRDLLSMLRVTGDKRERGSFDYTIEPLAKRHIDGVLEVLTESFGNGFDQNWFNWKHLSGPWGRSAGWVAVDDTGVIGVRLLLRWELHTDKIRLRALRPCDTATASRARGAGVFQRTSEAAIAAVQNECDVLYNTPNQLSRTGYFKIGFEEWTHVAQSVGLVVKRAAGLADPQVEPSGDGGRLRTPLTPEFLDWRYGSCPRFEYRIVGLASADSPSGIVYRTRQWHRFRLVVVAELWGNPDEREALLAAVAASEKCTLFWVTEQERSGIAFSFVRHATLVTYKNNTGAALPPPAFSVGDVEDVL